MRSTEFTAPIKPSVAYIKKNRLTVGGWGSFKHHLVKIGVIQSPDDSVPQEWQDAFKREVGR